MNKFKNGFTLIELLVVLSIVMSIVVVSGNIFYTALRSGSKTQVSLDLKQRGNYGLSVIEKMIREAKEVDCASDQVTIVYKDGQETSFSCSSGQVASDSANSAVLVDSIADCSTDFGFSCNLPQVGIGFTISENPDSPMPFKSSQINFQTTVTARNL